MGMKEWKKKLGKQEKTGSDLLAEAAAQLGGSQNSTTNNSGKKQKNKKSIAKRVRNACVKLMAGTFLSWGAVNYYAPDLELDKKLYDTVEDSTEKWVKWDGIKDTANGLFASATAEQDAFDLYNEKSSVEFMGAKGETSYFAEVADRWYAAMGRHDMFMRNAKNRAFMDDWYAQLDDLRDKPLAEQAKGVDALVDRVTEYKSDAEIYQRSEYWAAPIETASLKRGDCDDFAILKYFALRELGVDADRMYAVAVGSNGGQMDHMTLIVDLEDHSVLDYALNWVGITDLNRNFVVLDNDKSENGRLIQEDRTNFSPHYAMNEDGIWAVPKDSGFWFKAQQAPKPPKP